jgi:hypothetical protein
MPIEPTWPEQWYVTAAESRNFQRHGCDVGIALRDEHPVAKKARGGIGHGFEPGASKPTPPLEVEHPAPEEGKADKRQNMDDDDYNACFGSCAGGKVCKPEITWTEGGVTRKPDGSVTATGTASITCNCK